MNQSSFLIRALILSALAAGLPMVFGCGSYGNGGGGGGSIPAAPAGLTATAGNAQVALTWTASSGATLYYVKRSTTMGGPYTQVGTPSTTTFTDTGLTNGTKYFYVVSAYNSYGQSANSAEVSATPVPAVPSAPTGLTATPGNMLVTLTWTASAGATSYNVKRGTTSGGPYSTLPGPPTTNAFTDSGLTNGTLYFYVVTAVNTAGESGNSNQASATPSPVPAAPTGLTATIGNAQVALAWNVSASATSYNVKRSTVSGGPYTIVASPAATNYTNTGLANGTPYYYVVSAVNAIGESPNSSQVSATPATTTAVAVTVDLLTNRHPISQYIYGGSFPKDGPTISDSNTTMVRWGGNASTRYNWVNFATNAAADWYFQNRTMGNAPLYDDSRNFVANVAAAGGSPLMTIGMLPWVAKDGNASSYSFSVSKYAYSPCQVNPYYADDGNGVKQASDCTTNASAHYVTGNDPHDANAPLLDGPPAGGDPAGSVYRNQWVAALATAFNTAGAPHFYNMDNEIDIWAGTHRDVHPNPPTYTELRDTYIKEARAVKGWDPAAVRFGPVSCCWYFYWNSAAGGSDKNSVGGEDFLPWWLNEVAWNDAVVGNRSLDVFDVHAYTEAGASGLAQQQALALRVTRDWWDANYTSEAWFGTSSVTANQPMDHIPFRIPRMRALANTIYPGTALSFTEWSFAMAGEADFSTALADADAFGIMGRERVDYSSRWTSADPANPAYQAVKLYRNYDGSKRTFGQTSISVTHNADPSLFSVYAALSKTGAPLTIMVVNKDPGNAAVVTFALPGFAPGTFTSYTLSKTAPTTIVASASGQPWSATQTFPPYSATLLVVTGAASASPAAEWDLNPDTIQIPAGGSFTFQPTITSATSGSATVTLNSAQFDTSPAGLSLTIGKSLITQTPLTGNGAITIASTTGTAPGFYHFTVNGTDSNSVQQKQGGWVLVQKPAATLAKTTDPGSGAKGTPITLAVTLSAGSSGGTNTGASILFSTDAGNFSGASKTIVTTNSSGVASITLTLPSTAGTVHVNAEGPYGLGHPVITFTETAN